MTGAIWWDRHRTIRLPGKTTGVIGVLPTPAGSESRAWLRRCLLELQIRGCNRVLGPVEGSCWGAFGEGKNLLEDVPRLPGEPEVNRFRRADWRAAGFRTWRTWTTWRLPVELWPDRRLDRIVRDMGTYGIEIRQWTAADREELKPGILRLLMSWEGREPMYVHPTMGWARKWLGLRIQDVEPMLCYAAWRQDKLVGVIATELLMHNLDTAVIHGLLLDANTPFPGLGAVLLRGVARQAQQMQLETLYWRQAPDGSSLAATLRKVGTPARQFAVYRWRAPEDDAATGVFASTGAQVVPPAAPTGSDSATPA